MRPHRRTIRLRGFDYTEPGAYFVTIVCAGRTAHLGSVKDGEFEPGPMGKIVRDCWEAMPRHMTWIDLDAFIVMPNHVHGIILIREDGRGTPWRAPTAHQAEAFGRPRSGSLSTAIRLFKASCTRVVRARIPGFGRLWQRSFFDHIIRGRAELDRIRAYIQDNPCRWAEDPENPPRSP